jgi:hypothetical protein
VTAITALAWLVVEQIRKEGEPLRYVIVSAGALLLALAAGFVLVATVRVLQAVRATASEPNGETR